MFYGHKVSGGRSHWKGDYVDGPSTPLHPFGHGLSYTTFGFDSARLRRTAVRWNEAVEVDVELRNTGARAGDEVVQLYVRDSQASVTRPVLELKAFQRVTLEPGAACRVTFAVPVGQLGFYDRSLAYVVEPGALDVFVGTSSRDLVDAGTVTVEAGDAPVEKAFDGTVEVTEL